MTHLTYLAFELVWAFPVIALQLAVGWRALWHYRRVLLIALGIMTAYLSLADGVAIALGIWTLHANRIIGLRIVDGPVEEIIFFLVTNAMVVQSAILVFAWRQGRRLGFRQVSTAKGVLP
ncbi:MAG: lycopene cyclase domain-containing protein [Chloroflexota bacterium]